MQRHLYFQSTWTQAQTWSCRTSTPQWLLLRSLCIQQPAAAGAHMYGVASCDCTHGVASCDCSHGVASCDCSHGVASCDCTRYGMKTTYSTTWGLTIRHGDIHSTAWGHTQYDMRTHTKRHGDTQYGMGTHTVHV